jgi:hypothetical protein
MQALVLALLIQTAAPLRVVGVRLETTGEVQKILVEATGEWGPVPVTRDGDELVVSLPAASTARLEMPPVATPLRKLRLVRDGGSLQMRVTVASSVPFEVQRRGNLLTLAFGDTSGKGISPELLAAYESLRPPQAAAPDAADDAPFSVPAANEDEQLTGIGIGPLRFRPGVIVGYARSDTTLDSPVPAARYAPLRPLHARYGGSGSRSRVFLPARPVSQPRLERGGTAPDRATPGPGLGRRPRSSHLR